MNYRFLAKDILSASFLFYFIRCTYFINVFLDFNLPWTHNLQSASQIPQISLIKAALSGQWVTSLYVYKPIVLELL